MLASLIKFFRRDDSLREAARELYRQVILQARQPVFYSAMDVPDTLDGRFELLVLHAHFLIVRLTRIAPDGPALAQAVFDAMFADLDENLRIVGVGDLSVGKKIGNMGQAFYGRAEAYSRAVAAGEIEPALARNLYGTLPSGPSPGALAAMAAYIDRLPADLNAANDSSLREGRVAFPNLQLRPSN